MKVAIDVQPLASTGGIATYTRALLENLGDVDVVPIFAALRGRRAARDALPERWRGALSVPSLPARILERLRRLYGLQVRHETVEAKADLVHATNYLAPSTRLPTVVTVHDLSALRQPALHPLEVLRQMALLAGEARRARQVIAVSEVTARELPELLDVPASLVRVVPLAPTPLPAPDVGRLARWGLDAKPYVLFVGALEPRKNLPRLIAAFRSCRAAAGHTLVLAGPHAWGLAGVSEALSATRGGSGPVVLTGAVSREDLAALYSRAACFAFPSLWEGFGLPPLDAMQAGAPVVASRAGSLPEVLGEAALLVDPTDTGAIAEALGRVLGDRHLAAELRARGHERAATFSWSRTAEMTRAVYAEALS